MTDKYYVVDQTDAIHQEGTYAECRAFLSDPTAKEIAEVGGLTFSIVLAEDWQRRNAS